jgi:hypothetical protein
MFKLNRSLTAWQQENFIEVLKAEICTLGLDELPLQQGLSHSSYALADKLSATILQCDDMDSHISVKAGLFYSGIIAGCSCADDPSPVDETSEYCEVNLRIDKKTAETTVSLLS